MTNYVHAGDIKGLEKFEIELAKIGDFFQPRRTLRLTVTGVVRRQHVVALGEPRQEWRPARKTASAMQEQYRLAGAGAPHKSAALAHRHEGFLGIGHGSTLTRATLTEQLTLGKA